MDKHNTSSPSSTSSNLNHHFQPTKSFRSFQDHYADVATLQTDLQRAGLESSSLIIGVGKYCIVYEKVTKDFFHVFCSFTQVLFFKYCL